MQRRGRRFRRAGLALAALLVISAAAACGDSSSNGSATTTTAADVSSSTTSTSVADTTTTLASAPATDVALQAADYSYDAGGVTTVPAGRVHVTLTNGGTEEHQATIVRLKPGKALSDLAAAGATDPTGKASLALVDAFGGPNSAAPGNAASADAFLSAGDYLFVCFIPSPDGVPHVAKGMVMPFTVSAAAGSESAAPAGDETISVQDYSFTVPTAFSGSGTFTVDNKGPQPHEVAVYRIADGKTFDDVKAFYASQTPSGPPPTQGAGGIGAISPGGKATVDLALTSGSYAFMCFLPDATTGAPHFTLGMLQEVDVP